MALRPIDNALPVTPDRDRPKKQAKISARSQMNKQPQSQIGANNENGDQLCPPSNTEVTIDYIASADLKPITDPEARIQSLIQGLESKEWTKICDSLNDARRFALYNSALMLPMLENVMSVAVKAMKNPRSALCKTSIMASSDLFIAYGDKLLQPTNGSGAFDQLLLQLLLKSSQDKRFVCEEADKALKAMVQSLTPLALLRKLQACVGHVNFRVRAKAAVSISNCVSKMGPEELGEFGSVRLTQIAAELLNDRLPEAREAARCVVVSLYKSFTVDDEDQKQESWQSFCQLNLPPLHALSVLKITSLL